MLVVVGLPWPGVRGVCRIALVLLLLSCQPSGSGCMHVHASHMLRSWPQLLRWLVVLCAAAAALPALHRHTHTHCTTQYVVCWAFDLCSQLACLKLAHLLAGASYSLSQQLLLSCAAFGVAEQVLVVSLGAVTCVVFLFASIVTLFTV